MSFIKRFIKKEQKTQSRCPALDRNYSTFVNIPAQVGILKISALKSIDK